MLSFQTSGDTGPDIVLLHELGGSSQTFRWVTPQLEGFRVTCIDLPGTRGSAHLGETAGLPDMAAAVAATLEELLAGRPAVLGGIAGGAGTAAALAAASPHLVSGLLYASLGATIDEATAGYIHARVPIVREGGMEAVVDPSLLRSYPENLRADRPEIYADYRADFVASDVEGYVDQQLALARSGPDLGSYLAAVRAPTVVVGGEIDELFPRTAVDAAAAAAARLVARIELPGISHLPHLQAPVALAAALRLTAACADLASH